MRHECECDHNARNIHYQDTTGIFGDPGSDNESERNKYEKYKKLERNVENAIALLSKSIDPSLKDSILDLEDVIDQIKEEIEKIPTISTKNFIQPCTYIEGSGLFAIGNYPKLIFITEEAYNNLPKTQKVSPYFIYAIAPFTSLTPSGGDNTGEKIPRIIFGEDGILQRSYTIRGGNGSKGVNLDQDTPDTRNFDEIILPIYDEIEDNGEIKKYITENIINQFKSGFYWDNENGDIFKRKKTKESFLEELLLDYELTTNSSVYLQWNDNYENIKGLDYDLIMKYYELFKDENNNALITQDKWENFLKVFDPVGYYQIYDLDMDGLITSKDASEILRVTAKIGGDSNYINSLEEEYKQNQEIDFENKIGQYFALQIPRKQWASGIKKRKTRFTSSEASFALRFSTALGANNINIKNLENIFNFWREKIDSEVLIFDEFQT